MSEHRIHEVPVLPDPEKNGIGDILRQIPANAREHAYKLGLSAVAGLSLVVPSLHASEATPVHESTDNTELPAKLAAETLEQKVTGYWMLAEHGLVQAFGDAKTYGHGPSDSIAIAATPTGEGYWILQANNATVLPAGDAKFGVHGHELDWRQKEKAVGLAATPDGEGVWSVTTAGRVFAGGKAPHFGDMWGKHLNQPMRGIIPTPSGKGYWLQAADGGVFSFGDAKFYGSTGDMKLNAPIIGMVPDQTDGEGYYLIGADGGIFSFGAKFYGSMGDKKLNQPIIKGIPSPPGTEGYAMLASDGGIFNFGKLPFYGSAANNPAMKPVVGAALKIKQG